MLILDSGLSATQNCGPINLSVSPECIFLEVDCCVSFIRRFWDVVAEWVVCRGVIMVWEEGESNDEDNPTVVGE